jgi:hypothetical protein
MFVVSEVVAKFAWIVTTIIDITYIPLMSISYLYNVTQSCDI